MTETFMDTLKKRLTGEHYQRLAAINNRDLHSFISHFIEVLNPDQIIVCTDSKEDREFVRNAALKTGEEIQLAIKGQTIHFDGYFDQGRDKENTRILLSEGLHLSDDINTMERQEGLRNLQTVLKNIMQGHTLYIRFFCLGPTNSVFAIPAVQLTDSAYVAHSEDLLYRPGYEEFKRGAPDKRFFKFVHSAGELKEMVSANIDKRRVYIDLDDDIVYSVNTQYGGNSLGLKKLAMRLAIKHASQEGWLTEHMFIMGVHGPNKRRSYFAGAFPSLCGKTSTSMMKGESIVGDDIAYLRIKEGAARAVNVEQGLFGIIQGINSKDDPIIWEALHRPGEVIFSNVLMTRERTCHWIGKDGEVPPEGTNHAGSWYPGKKDVKGKEIKASHPNARFTMELRLLENCDPKLHAPEGVVLCGIIYGGRDSDTCVPVEQSFNWEHGIITKGASLESETTAATLGTEGVREWNPMSNIDFLSIPIGTYIENNIAFGRKLDNPPHIFSVNYFLRDKEGHFLNEKMDKAVWLKWMELRCNRDVFAIKTPTGFIPLYQDLRHLFKETLNKDYTEAAYSKQFTARIPEALAKAARIMKIFSNMADVPQLVFSVLEAQQERLLAAQKKFGNYILPEQFTEKE